MEDSLTRQAKKNEREGQRERPDQEESVNGLFVLSYVLSSLLWFTRTKL